MKAKNVLYVYLLTCSLLLITLNLFTPTVVNMNLPSPKLTASFTSKMVPYCTNLLPLDSLLAIANLLDGDWRHLLANNLYLGSQTYKGQATPGKALVHTKTGI